MLCVRTTLYQAFWSGFEVYYMTESTPKDRKSSQYEVVLCVDAVYVPGQGVVERAADPELRM